MRITIDLDKLKQREQEERAKVQAAEKKYEAGFTPEARDRFREAHAVWVDFADLLHLLTDATFIAPFKVEEP